jgi:hypothetical protein
MTHPASFNAGISTGRAAPGGRPFLFRRRAAARPRGARSGHCWLTCTPRPWSDVAAAGIVALAPLYSPDGVRSQPAAAPKKPWWPAKCPAVPPTAAPFKHPFASAEELPNASPSAAAAMSKAFMFASLAVARRTLGWLLSSKLRSESFRLNRFLHSCDPEAHIRADLARGRLRRKPGLAVQDVWHPTVSARAPSHRLPQLLDLGGAALHGAKHFTNCGVACIVLGRGAGCIPTRKAARARGTCVDGRCRADGASVSWRLWILAVGRRRLRAPKCLQWRAPLGRGRVTGKTGSCTAIGG